MRVSFDGGRLNERGVAVALYDYAFHARALLGVEPVILHDASGSVDDEQLARFASVFPVRAYRSVEQRLEVIEDERVDVAYCAQDRARALSAVAGAPHRRARSVQVLQSARRRLCLHLRRGSPRRPPPRAIRPVPHIVDPPQPLGKLALGVRRARRRGRGRTTRRERPVQRSLRQAGASRRRSPRVPICGSCCSTPIGFRTTSASSTCRAQPRSPARRRLRRQLATSASTRAAAASASASPSPSFSPRTSRRWSGGADATATISRWSTTRACSFAPREDLTRALIAFEPRPGGGAWRQRVEPFTPEAVMPLFARVFLEPGSRPKPKLPLGFRLAARARMRLQRWRDDYWISR